MLARAWLSRWLCGFAGPGKQIAGEVAVRKTLFAVLLLAAPLLAETGAAQTGLGTVATPVPAMETGSGVLEGKVLDSGVKAWLGIPYVQPPVGDLRWKEPQPIHWVGTYHADRKMPECPQISRPHDT